jgi:hypothetical protein
MFLVNVNLGLLAKDYNNLLKLSLKLFLLFSFEFDKNSAILTGL